MNNQELLAKIEEWVDENEEEFIDDIDGYETCVVESQSLITFIKKLLHE